MTPRLQQLLQFQADRPGDAFLLFALAKEYEKLDDKDAALAHYQQIVANTPDYVGVYYHLGKLQEALEQLAEAVATYKAGIAVAQRIGDRHAHSELAAAKMELTDEDD